MSLATAIHLTQIAKKVKSEIPDVYTATGHPTASDNNSEAVGILRFTSKDSDKTVRQFNQCLDKTELEFERKGDHMEVTATVIDYEATVNNTHSLQQSLEEYS